MKQQIENLLQQDFNNQDLQDELEILALTDSQVFLNQVTTWLPALCERDADFFAPFVNRYLVVQNLTRQQRDAVAELLPVLDAIQNDTQFRLIYQQAMDVDRWNDDLLALAQSNISDQELQHILKRRAMRNYQLNEEAALALYNRNPGLFGDFIRTHIRWRQGNDSYTNLRSVIRKHGDHELYWHLFRMLADGNEWEREMRYLLNQAPPARRILLELSRRQVARNWSNNPGILIDFIGAYGEAVMPYIEQHGAWIAGHAPQRLVEAIRALGDEQRVWRVVFTTNNSRLWNSLLRDLLAQQMSTEELHETLQYAIPPKPAGRFWWPRWQLDQDIALALYQRDPVVFRPLLEELIDRRIYHPTNIDLFAAALDAGDQGFLDLLSYYLLQQISNQINRAYPQYYTIEWLDRQPNSVRQRHMMEVSSLRKQIEDSAGMLTRRFDQLYAQAPQTYLHHAVNILSRFEKHDVLSLRRDGKYNPALNYLIYRHRDDWLRSPVATGDLLESPNIHIRIIALDMLGQGGPDAAARVCENLIVLRAMLLSGTHRATKKRVLACLDLAAKQSGEYAREILPLLEEAIDVRSKRSITPRLIASFVRLHHRQRAHPDGQPLVVEPVYYPAPF